RTATLASHDKPIASITLLDEDHVMAITSDGTAHVTGLPATSPIANVSPRASVSAHGLVASVTSDGVLEAIDLEAGERWTLAQPKGRTFGFAQISPDGRRVLATTQTGVLVWTLRSEEH